MRSRGVVLISTLFFVLLVGVIARAIIITGPGKLRMSNQAFSEPASRRAAEAGLAYCQARLRGDPAWKGDADKMVVNTPNLQVLEDRGNVFGLVRDLEGRVSQFRVRFNYQDGTGGGDDMDDPPAGHKIDNPYVSLNNLQGLAEAAAPQADAGSFAVTGDGPDKVQGGCALILVEGRTGAALQSLTAPDGTPGVGEVTTRVYQFMLTGSSKGPIPDSPLSAAGAITTHTVKGMTASAVNTTDAPRVRSKSEMHVLTASGAKNTLTMNGEVSTSTGAVDANVSGSVTVNTEKSGDDFHNVKWEDVPKADPSSAGTAVIPGGTYVFWYDGSVHYYDMSFKDYQSSSIIKTLDPKTYLPTNPGVVLSNNLQEVRSSANVASAPTNITLNTDSKNWIFEMNVTGDVAVQASTKGVNSIAVVNYEGRQLYKGDKTYAVSEYIESSNTWCNPAVNITGATFSCEDETLMLCNVNGNNATLTSGGNATVASTSVKLEKKLDPDNLKTATQKFSLYTKGDLTLSTYQYIPGFDIWELGISIPEMDFYGPLKLEGLIYTWGDVKCYGANPTGASLASMLADITLQGALVAYGGDPASGTPGSNMKGKVDIFANDFQLIYDPLKLGDGTAPDITAADGGLKRTFFGEK